MEANWIWIVVANGAVLLAGFGLVIATRRGVKRKWKDQFIQFDDVLRSVEMTNSAYFRSLELMLKNLELVRSSTEHAEQRLAGIIMRPGMERDGRHETAALLLSTGEKPAKVASMLNLPLSQVTRARDPQKASTRARKAAAEKNVAEQSTAELKSRMGLWSARVKKIFPQAASSENRGNGPVENGADGLNGAAGA